MISKRLASTGILLFMFFLPARLPLSAESSRKPDEPKSGQQDQKPQYWTLRYDLEYRKDTGNTSSFDLRTGFDLSMKRPEDDLHLTSSYAKGKTDGEISADRMDLQAKYNRLVTKSTYVMAFLLYEQDKTRDIGRRWQIGPTVGKRFYDTPELFLSSDVGPIWDETRSAPNGHVDLEASLKGLWNIDLSYIPFADVKFEQRIRSTIGLKTADDSEETGDSKETAFEINSETSVYIPVYQRLFLKLSLIDHYNSQPQPDLKENDLSLVTSFSYLTHF
ncbi:MAG: DUF481 domain-containing protein [bacterium]